MSTDAAPTELRAQLQAVATGVARVRSASMFEKARAADDAMVEVLALLVGLVQRVEQLGANR